MREMGTSVPLPSIYWFWHDCGKGGHSSNALWVFACRQEGGQNGFSLTSAAVCCRLLTWNMTDGVGAGNLNKQGLVANAVACVLLRAGPV
jgi:hypothetical protein